MSKQIQEMKKTIVFLLLLFNANFAFGVVTENLSGECDACYSTMIAVFQPSEYTCAPGYYLPAGNNWITDNDGCTICPANNYCPGGAYTFNETVPQGITACSTGLYSPSGMLNANQCGHILHIGNEVVYLHSVKKTSPAMHVKIGNDIFYGNMTTADVSMHAGTARKFKMNYNGVAYSVYDDSVDVGE